jgi:hypothetical protein
MLEKQSVGNQVSPGLPYLNTTELAGFMKVNDTPAEQLNRFARLKFRVL